MQAFRRQTLAILLQRLQNGRGVLFRNGPFAGDALELIFAFDLGCVFGQQIRRLGTFRLLKGGATGQALMDALQSSPHREIDLEPGRAALCRFAT